MNNRTIYNQAYVLSNFNDAHNFDTLMDKQITKEEAH